jgi:phytoene/squalene synthetase
VNQMITNIASSITKAASKQTYYTVRFLADRERREDAYRAYGYFRWVDDILDSDSGTVAERTAFLERQKSLLESCYRGEWPWDVDYEEQMLIDLIKHDQEKNSGLQAYLRNMMEVMDFDTRRRGRIISQAELNDYTRWLAIAVTEALHYFVGHDDFTPHDETRYLAVYAAHIVHMLRDTVDDAAVGYYNIPREVLEASAIKPLDVQSEAYRTWVKSRVNLARKYFEAGKRYFARVQNLRCRLAGIAYMARFEWLLDTIEREGYSLRPQYNEKRSLGTGLKMSRLVVSSLNNMGGAGNLPQPIPSRPISQP